MAASEALAGMALSSATVEEEGREGQQAARPVALMPPEVSHHICIAQVIVTAAGAVRQLLDNAIDAGATNIEISTRNFGIDSISVADNGSGIPETSFGAICKPHSTSKLTEYDDLLSLNTLGFRGEALNALCALADVTITTRTDDSNYGHLLVFDRNGNITRREITSRETGTTIEARSLFVPLPVRRREFERTAKRDFSRLLVTVQEFALLRPDVRFNVFSHTQHGRHHALATPGGSNSTLSTVIGSLFAGKGSRIIAVEPMDAIEDAREQLGERAADDVNQIFVRGFVSSCGLGEGFLTRAGGSERQFVFVNGRPVDYPRLTRLANEVYQQYNQGQFPLLILHISMPRAWVDVNVTPEKRTVFCQKEKLLLCSARSSLLAAFKPFAGTMTSLEEKSPKAERSFSGFALTQSPIRLRSQQQQQQQQQLSAISAHSQHRRGGGGRDAEESPPPPEARRGRTTKTTSMWDDEDEQADTSMASPHRKASDASFMSSSSADPSSPGFSHLALSNMHLFRQTTAPQPQRVAPITPTGFRSNIICAPQPKKPRLNIEQGIRTLQSFLFKVVPHSRVSAALDAEEAPEPARAQIAPFGRATLERMSRREADDSENSDLATLFNKAQTNKENTTAESRHEAKPEMEEENREGRREFHWQSEEDREDGRQNYQEYAKQEVQSQQQNAEQNEDPYAWMDEEEEREGRNEERAEERREVGKSSETTREHTDRGGEEEAEDDEEEMMTDSQKARRDFVMDNMDRPEQVLDVTEEEILAWEEAGREAEREAEERASQEEEKIRLAALTMTVDKDERAEEELRQALRKTDFARMEVLGQFNDGFIVTRLGSHLFIVDQHASDEKANFERLQKRAYLRTQNTIVPLSLDVGAVEATVIREHTEIFRASGFEFAFPEGDEPSNAASSGTVTLVSSPRLEGCELGKEDICEMAAQLAITPGSMYRPAKLRKVFASKACRQSVMIGTRLDEEMMREIVNRLGTLDHPWSCPHGRPTLRHLADARDLLEGESGREGEEDEREGIDGDEKRETEGESDREREEEVEDYEGFGDED